MAKYRQIHTTFWDDGFVLDLTPEEKYFYLYLMTNSNTTQCGIYELPYRVIEMQTGYNRDTVVKLLSRFIEYGKVLYNESTKEIMLLNWAKYNFINSPKVKKCIEKELQQVKHIPFVKSYVTSLEQYGYHIDTVSIPYLNKSNPKEPSSSYGKGSIPYRYPMDSPYIDLGEEEEKEQEEEQEKEEEKEQQQEGSQSSVTSLNISNFGSLAIFYEKNIGPLLPVISQELGLLYDNFKDVELIQEAFKIAIQVNAKNKMRYADGILRNWKAELITSYEQLKSKEARDKNAGIQRRVESNGNEHLVDLGF